MVSVGLVLVELALVGLVGTGEGLAKMISACSDRISFTGCDHVAFCFCVCARRHVLDEEVIGAAALGSNRGDTV